MHDFICINLKKQDVGRRDRYEVMDFVMFRGCENEEQACDNCDKVVLFFTPTF